MSIVLDTPEQINAWVILSRISQCHLHMKGLTVKGLAGWLKRNIPDEFLQGNEKTVKALYPRLLDWADALGVQLTAMKEECNYQILVTPTALNGLYFDQGIVASMEEIEAMPEIVEAYAEGRVVIMRTMADVRERDPKIQMVKGE